MTPFDYAVLAAIVLSLAVGVWRGVIGEILALLAWVAAFLGARVLANDVGSMLMAADMAPHWRQAVGFLAVFVAILVMFSLARWLVSRFLKAVGLRPLDRILGALFGIARGVLVVWVTVLLAGLTALPAQPWWQAALLAPPFETAVLASKPWLPPDLAKRIRYR